MMSQEEHVDKDVITVGSQAGWTQLARERENVDLPYFMGTYVHGQGFCKVFFKCIFNAEELGYLQKTYLKFFMRELLSLNLLFLQMYILYIGMAKINFSYEKPFTSKILKGPQK